jgi:hypothetical protein
MGCCLKRDTSQNNNIFMESQNDEKFGKRLIFLNNYSAILNINTSCIEQAKSPSEEYARAFFRKSSQLTKTSNKEMQRNINEKEESKPGERNYLMF